MWNIWGKWRAAEGFKSASACTKKNNMSRLGLSAFLVMLVLNSSITNQFWTIIPAVCHMWCTSNLALLSGVKLCVSLEWFHVSTASPVWSLGTDVARSPPGVVQYTPPLPKADVQARLFGYFAQALWQEETMTEAFRTWEPPAELNKLCLQPQWQEISLRSPTEELIAHDRCILILQIKCLCFV